MIVHLLKRTKLNLIKYSIVDKYKLTVIRIKVNDDMFINLITSRQSRIFWIVGCAVLHQIYKLRLYNILDTYNSI